MFRGTNSEMWNILHIKLIVKDILHNTISPTEHCYGSE